VKHKRYSLLGRRSNTENIAALFLILKTSGDRDKMKEVWGMENTPTFDCPEEYKGKLFLTASDMQTIFQLGENKTYEYLKEAPFRVIKVGNQIRVVAVSFWKWYNEGV
jgi:hypothetical protein